MVAKFRWKSSDLDLLPDDGKRYEIIDGELIVTRAPNWGHQKACQRIATMLDVWSLETSLGEVVQSPGVLFAESDNVIPDVVWVSKARLPDLLDKAGHLLGAPDLAIEVLSPGEENQRRDRDLKLRLYSVQGVREYWIIDWQLKSIEIYRRASAQLALKETLLVGDAIESPMLPEFSCPVDKLFV